MSKRFDQFRRFSGRAALVAAAFVLTSTSGLFAESIASPLLARDQLARLGLVRAWFAQVQLDSAQSHVQRAILSGNQLFVLTSAGTLHAFDAQTGATMWIMAIGDARHPSLGPTANAELVAVVNGNTLHVLQRNNGQPKIVRRIGGTTGAAPVLSPTYCFVPMLTGRLEGYSLLEPTQRPWFFQSFGRAMTPPRVTDSSVVWSTDSGHVYAANSTLPGVRYLVETGSEIVATPGYQNPMLYVATISGELIALHETTGAAQWRFAADYPIVRSPAAIGGRVFVSTLEPEMYCIDGANGALLWGARTIKQFAALSRERVYAIDNLSSLVVLDAASGAMLQRMPTGGTVSALVNDQTDRLYLISDDGKVQCLHEVSATAPLVHNPIPAAPPAQAAPLPAAATLPTAQPQPAAQPPAAVPPAGDNPFDTLPSITPDTTPAPATPATPPTPPPGENPFGEPGGGATPAGGGDNPFGPLGGR
jgi:outer membrane protein assembly factor BamB